MANEMKHVSTGISLTQAQYESTLSHIFNNQATGDVMYASSATQLSRLGIGSTAQVLMVAAGIPSWSSAWAGTVISPVYGGTGKANNVASTLTITGAYATTLTVTNTTGVTLPTTGTLATLAGSEVFTNKTLTSPTITGTIGTPGLTLPEVTLVATMTVTAYSFVGALDSDTGFKKSGTQVVGARVVDARCDDVVDNTYGAEEAGVLDALRDAMITHGLIAAA